MPLFHQQLNVPEPLRTPEPSPERDISALERLSSGVAVARGVGAAMPGYFDPFPVDQLRSLACGMATASPHFQTHFADVNGRLWPDRNAYACGACLAVECSPAAACRNGSRVVVQVVDDCGSCGNGDIILSPQALR